MKIKTYVINLKDSVDRRKTVLAETAKYPIMDVELVEAVDGRNMPPEEIKKCFDDNAFIYRYQRNPKGGEIGCTLSHWKCYRKLLESKEEFALILEDDVKFIYPEKVEKILEEMVCRYRHDKPYWLTLAMHIIYYPRQRQVIGPFICYKIYNAYGTCAYLINRKAAARLLAVSLPYTLADDYFFIRRKGIRVEGIYPTFAVGRSTQNTIETEIQQENVSFYKRSFSQHIDRYYQGLCREILHLSGVLSYRHFIKGINE